MSENEKQIELGETKQIELPKLDVTEFIGQKTKIAEVTEHKGLHGFYIKVVSNPIATLGEGDKAKDITASKVFGLQEDENGQIGWGADTKLGLFLKKMEVSHYKELVGKEVIVQTSPNKDGKDFLSF